MAEKYIIEEIKGYVGEITFNRPSKHNAINDELIECFRSSLEKFIDNPDIRAILIRGEGRSFCSGRDTNVLGHRKNSESDYVFIMRSQKVQKLILECPKPVIASLKGAVIGAGFEFALAADIRVSAKNSIMSLPEIRYGLIPDLGGTQLLTSIIGRSKAKYHIMTGNSFSAEYAFDLGIVDWVVENEEVDNFAREIATEISKAPPLNVMQIKALVDSPWSGAINQGIKHELTAQSMLFKTADYHEARAAMKDARAPVYEGR